MKKSIYVLAVTLIIASLVISSTASIPIMKNNSETENSTNDYETSVTPKNDDSFIHRLMRIFSGEIIDVDISDSAAINNSKIDGVPSHDHDERYYTQAEVDALLEGIESIKACAGIEDYLTVDSLSRVTIDFPISFTDASDILLSASVIVITSATCAGNPALITNVVITTEDAVITLQGWNGASYEDLQQDDEVQVSYTAIEQ
jgi:hypothetical protein